MVDVVCSRVIVYGCHVHSLAMQVVTAQTRMVVVLDRFARAPRFRDGIGSDWNAGELGVRAAPPHHRFLLLFNTVESSPVFCIPYCDRYDQLAGWTFVSLLCVIVIVTLFCKLDFAEIYGNCLLVSDYHFVWQRTPERNLVFG